MVGCRETLLHTNESFSLTLTHAVPRREKTINEILVLIWRMAATTTTTLTMTTKASRRAEKVARKRSEDARDENTTKK